MELATDNPNRRCWGRTKNLHRCARTGPWRFFCKDHQYQWIVFLGFLVFTVGTSTLSYYSFFSEPPSPDTEAVALQLRQEIHSRFETEVEAARAAGQNWEVIRELERRRDAALGRVDEVILTIKEGLAGNPSPIFTEATRILEQEGAEAEPLMRQVVEILLLFGLHTGYDDPHKTTMMGNYRSLLAELGRDEDEQQAEVEALIESVKSRVNP